MAANGLRILLRIREELLSLNQSVNHWRHALDYGKGGDNLRYSDWRSIQDAIEQYQKDNKPEPLMDVLDSVIDKLETDMVDVPAEQIPFPNLYKRPWYRVTSYDATMPPKQVELMESKDLLERWPWLGVPMSQNFSKVTWVVDHYKITIEKEH